MLNFSLFCSRITCIRRSIRSFLCCPFELSCPPTSPPPSPTWISRPPSGHSKRLKTETNGSAIVVWRLRERIHQTKNVKDRLKKEWKEKTKSKRYAPLLRVLRLFRTILSSPRGCRTVCRTTLFRFSRLTCPNGKKEITKKKDLKKKEKRTGANSYFGRCSVCAASPARARARQHTSVSVLLCIQAVAFTLDASQQPLLIPLPRLFTRLSNTSSFARSARKVLNRAWAGSRKKCNLHFAKPAFFLFIFFSKYLVSNISFPALLESERFGLNESCDQ